MLLVILIGYMLLDLLQDLFVDHPSLLELLFVYLLLLAICIGHHDLAMVLRVLTTMSVW